MASLAAAVAQYLYVFNLENYFVYNFVREGHALVDRGARRPWPTSPAHGRQAAWND
jgi:hypothetical protein